MLPAFSLQSLSSLQSLYALDNSAGVYAALSKVQALLGAQTGPTRKTSLYLFQVRATPSGASVADSSTVVQPAGATTSSVVISGPVAPVAVAAPAAIAATIAKDAAYLATGGTLQTAVDLSLAAGQRALDQARIDAENAQAPGWNLDVVSGAKTLTTNVVGAAQGVGTAALLSIEAQATLLGGTQGPLSPVVGKSLNDLNASIGLNTQGLNLDVTQSTVNKATAPIQLAIVAAAVPAAAGSILGLAPATVSTIQKAISPQKAAPVSAPPVRIINYPVPPPALPVNTAPDLAIPLTVGAAILLFLSLAS